MQANTDRLWTINQFRVKRLYLLFVPLFFPGEGGGGGYGHVKENVSGRGNFPRLVWVLKWGIAAFAS